MTKQTQQSTGVGSPTPSKTSSNEARHKISYCSMRVVREREFGPGINDRRLRLIRMVDKKWVNGTVLHYYFFDKPTDGESMQLSTGGKKWMPWTTSEAEKNVVRKAFETWTQVKIGLEFKEVSSRDEAEVRIGFMRGDGAWSYIGRDVLSSGPAERTMNFGWDLTSHPHELDTAIHEIGHTLGFPHEHQNPHAGIVWDEEAVYAALGQPPNSWDRQTTFFNIIQKINPDSVQGSNWDPDSIMHYPFEPGLIKQPEKYRTGLNPAGGLSARDQAWVKTFYPALTQQDYTELKPFQAIQLELAPGQQRDFTFTPTATRPYEVRTFGASDTVLVLFEEVNGELKYLAGDDDSGEDRNAYMKLKLFAGRRYVLRLRLYYAERSGGTAVMLW
jgi:hypothetical protein